MVGEQTGDSEMDREEGDEIVGARERASVRAWPAWGVCVGVGRGGRVGA